ncbi:MFS transporter [Simkania sp.]|uniref:MFS transporter n=1 Tax=Simkania sp. TaxID=34094 RepID=UPI003B517592
MMEKDSRSHLSLGILIWSLAALFFLYEFFLRVFVSTISDQVIADLSLTAQQFATMGAGYYLIYSFMQLPVGILVDRFGARLLLTIAVFLAGLGGFWFAFVEGFLSGFLSRCFMGFGSSFAYVCLLVLALNWFPRKHFGLMAGIANFLGAIGPILAGGPLALLLTLFHSNWRLVVGGIGALGFVLTVVIGLFVRNTPPRQKGEIIHLEPGKESLFSRLGELVRIPQVWVIILYAGFVYVCLPLLGAYWGTSFLQARGFSRTIAAFIASMMWIGLGVGSPVLGKLSDSIKRRKPILYGTAFLGMIVTIVVVYFHVENKWVYMVLFFLIGFVSAAQSVSFAAIAEHVPSKLHATAIGINNTMIMLFAAILPPIVSAFIGRSAAMHHEKAGHFTAADFQAGFFFMPIFYLCAYLLALFFIRETYCRQQFEVVKVDKSDLS